MYSHPAATSSVWVGTNNERHPVKTMDDSHLCAALNWVVREAQRAIPSLKTPSALDNHCNEHCITWAALKLEATRRGMWSPMSPAVPFHPDDDFRAPAPKFEKPIHYRFQTDIVEVEDRLQALMTSHRLMIGQLDTLTLQVEKLAIKVSDTPPARRPTSRRKR